ncbi:unnamed protein product [Caenorhabditis bovis]|uniref:Mediator of RNA polymerase II transcription subunit 27 n=1 Tax=Caenorhabditis bovis TaxID=2654633 RepID=A0A8S1ECD9_9PELO|nr:unnamed protein product [Caenorhabditis bovis]
MPSQHQQGNSQMSQQQQQMPSQHQQGNLQMPPPQHLGKLQMPQQQHPGQTQMTQQQQQQQQQQYPGKPQMPQQPQHYPGNPQMPQQHHPGQQQMSQQQQPSQLPQPPLLTKPVLPPQQPPPMGGKPGMMPQKPTGKLQQQQPQQTFQQHLLMQQLSQPLMKPMPQMHQQQQAQASKPKTPQTPQQQMAAQTSMQPPQLPGKHNQQSSMPPPQQPMNNSPQIQSSPHMTNSPNHASKIPQSPLAQPSPKQARTSSPMQRQMIPPSSSSPIPRQTMPPPTNSPMQRQSIQPSPSQHAPSPLVMGQPQQRPPSNASNPRPPSTTGQNRSARSTPIPKPASVGPPSVTAPSTTSAPNVTSAAGVTTAPPVTTTPATTKSTTPVPVAPTAPLDPFGETEPIPAAKLMVKATQAQTNDAMTRCSNCLYLIRKLRAMLLKVQNVALATDFDHDQNPAVDRYKLASQIMNDIKNIYERLEGQALKIPHIFALPDENPYREFLKEAHMIKSVPPAAHPELEFIADDMIDATNWNEGNYQMYYYVSELMRSGVRRRYTSYSIRPLVLTCGAVAHSSTTGNIGAFCFEQAVRGMKKEIQQKGLGISVKVLKTSSANMVVEFKYSVSGPDKTDKTPVCLMKFLIIASNGHLQYINIIAPFEEWHEEKDFGGKVLDPTHPSRYDIYRKLTYEANRHLRHSFSFTNRWSATTLTQVVTIFLKLRDVFDFRCKNCKNILKGWQPPTHFDIRQPRETAVHDSCL